MLQVVELDAEIKHAFTELQTKDELTKHLQSHAESMQLERDRAQEELEKAREKIKNCHMETELAASLFSEKLVSCPLLS